MYATATTPPPSPANVAALLLLLAPLVERETLAAVWMQVKMELSASFWLYVRVFDEVNINKRIVWCVKEKEFKMMLHVEIKQRFNF